MYTHSTALGLAAILFAAANPAFPAAPAKPSTASQEQVVDFGRSVRNRPMTAYVLGSGPNVTMVFGGFHGNERGTPGVVNDLRRYLEENLEQWRGCRVILVPYANPDGWMAATRVNANHVDINRNFPGTWKISFHAGRHNPGRRPASEPETRAIMQLIDDYAPAKIISIHQPLDLINWTGATGQSLADVMRRQNGYRMAGNVGYATPGSFGDYCGRVKGIAVVTLELPSQPVSTAWRANRAAFLAAIAFNPTLTLNKTPD